METRGHWFIIRSTRTNVSKCLPMLRVDGVWSAFALCSSRKSTRQIFGVLEHDRGEEKKSGYVSGQVYVLCLHTL